MSEAAADGPDPAQPFACDGAIGEEKLYELLAVGGEYPALDYKRELDLGSPAKKLDFIKDCAAMMNLPRGGYIVVGAEDDGKPAIGFSPPTKEMFDSAQLVQAVKGYVDGAIDIRAQVHTVSINGQPSCLAVIYVVPPADGFPAVIFKDGTSPGPSGRQARVHFRAGTVYTRVGTTNALVRHQEWSRVLHRFKDLQRADARADVDALLHRFVQMMGPTPATGPIPPDLDMDSATFTEAVRSTLDAKSHPVIKRFLGSAKVSYRTSPDSERKSHVLNRIAAVASEAVLMDDLKAVSQVVDTLFDLYKSHLTSPTRTSGTAEAPARWLEIILRVMAIGSMAIREGMYHAIPTLTLRSIGDATYAYHSWIRHGLTMASRERLLADTHGAPWGGGLIGMTVEVVMENPELRPDIPNQATESDAADQVLDSLCQFDLLWCFLSLASDQGRNPSAAAYPSCSAYNEHRASPALMLIDNDSDIRRAIFGDIKDGDIADSIVNVLEMARKQSWNFGGYWRGADELPLNGFTRKHARPQD